MSIQRLLLPETKNENWASIFVNKINGISTDSSNLRIIASKTTDPALNQNGVQFVPSYPAITNIGSALPFINEQFDTETFGTTTGGFIALKEGLYEVSIQLKLLVTSGSADAIRLMTPPGAVGLSPTLVMATTGNAPLNSTHNINATISVYLEPGTFIRANISAINPIGTFDCANAYLAINARFLG